ncbi:MAG: M23 family metallopeptidase [Deltaproteobacteria bacterium]|nr:M23 family metallopeptidase [Deltaproteobacteria bacterium]
MKKTDFCRDIIELNKKFMTDFKRWIFKEGMLFNSYEKWWDKGKRISAHEGIDFWGFETLSGGVKRLNAKVKAPALFDGEVVKIKKDFLGKSIYIRHSDIISEAEECLYTFYGHLKPFHLLGQRVKKRDAIGFVSDKSLKIPAHMHISLAWIAKNFDSDNIAWNDLWNNRFIRLVDPIFIVKKCL